MVNQIDEFQDDNISPIDLDTGTLKIKKSLDIWAINQNLYHEDDKIELTPTQQTNMKRFWKGREVNIFTADDLEKTHRDIKAMAQKLKEGHDSDSER